MQANTNVDTEIRTSNEDYRDKSFWLQNGAYEAQDALSEELNADVVIVGGGFTGLSAAYFLKRTEVSLDVVLLEKHVVGFGASGRNGGFVMPLLGWNIPDVYRRLGNDRTKRAYEFMYEAMDHIERMVSEEQMVCEYEKTGYVMMAVNRSRLPHLEKEARLAQAMGFDYTLLDRDGLSQFIKSDAFCGGFYDPRCAILNPALYAREMRRVVMQMGVRVFEASPVIQVDEGPSVTVHTQKGRVVAKKMVLATNAYSADLGYFRHRMMPVHTYIALTEPLTDAQIREIGWEKRASLETARNLIHYFRLTADNRIAFGGEDAQVYFGSRMHDMHDAINAKLQARLGQFFPTLRGVRFTHAWGGPVGFTLDFFPTIGVSGSHKNIYHSLGYCGHGVSMANYSGAVLTDLVFERDTERTQLFFINRKPIVLPPEPLRWLFGQSYRRTLQAQDWWQSRTAPVDQRGIPRQPYA